MYQNALNPAFQIRRFHLAARLALKSKRPVAPWVQEGWSFEDHKPSKHPDTPEKRKAAAMKYGLREGDYKPMPADEGRGDYPDLGRINYAVKDPYESWSDVRYRRNFGEPMHSEAYMRAADRFITTDVESRSSPGALLSTLGTTLIIIGLIYLLVNGGTPTYVKPGKPKQYPYDFERAYPYSDPRAYPLTHYTFEPAESE